MSVLCAWEGNWWYAFACGGKIQTAFSPVSDADRAATYPGLKASGLKCLLTRSPEHVTIFYRR